MNDSQLTEIRNYLLSKKLPIDILMELNDHFVSQITDLMKEESLSFENALKETQLNWNKDLRLYWSGSADLEDKTDLARKVTKQQFRSVFDISAKLAIVGTLLTIGLSQIVSLANFIYLFSGIIIILFFAPTVYYFFHLKDFKLVKKYDNYVLTYLQNYAVGGIVVTGLSVQIVLRLKDISAYFYEVFNPLHFSLASIGLGIGLFLLYLWSAYTLISEMKYIKTIQKVKPFLKYLKASR